MAHSQQNHPCPVAYPCQGYNRQKAFTIRSLTMQCSKCGNDNKVDASFCTRCGSSLSAPASEAAHRGENLAEVIYDKQDQLKQIVPWLIDGEELFCVFDCKGAGTGFRPSGIPIRTSLRSVSADFSATKRHCGISLWPANRSRTGPSNSRRRRSLEGSRSTSGEWFHRTPVPGWSKSRAEPALIG